MCSPAASISITARSRPRSRFCKTADCARWPQDARAARFTELVRAAGANAPLACLLRQAGASRRTMERLFRSETGMSLGQWLRRARLLEGLRRMAAGGSVSAAAFDLGYSSPSAFISMFRKQLGATPARPRERSAHTRGLSWPSWR